MLRQEYQQARAGGGRQSGSEMSDEHVPPPGKIVTHAGFLILPAALTRRLHGNVGTGSSTPK